MEFGVDILSGVVAQPFLLENTPSKPQRMDVAA